MIRRLSSVALVVVLILSAAGYVPDSSAAQPSLPSSSAVSSSGGSAAAGSQASAGHFGAPIVSSYLSLPEAALASPSRSPSPRATSSPRSSASPRVSASPRASASPRSSASPRASASQRGGDPYGCNDLEDYLFEVGVAAIGTIDLEFLETEDFSTLTDRELNLYANQVGELIEALEEITPPKAAEDFHEATINSFVLLERMLREYALTGSVFALLPYAESLDAMSWDLYYAEQDGYEMCGSQWVDVFGYPEMPES